MAHVLFVSAKQCWHKNIYTVIFSLVLSLSPQLGEEEIFFGIYWSATVHFCKSSNRFWTRGSWQCRNLSLYTGTVPGEEKGKGSGYVVYLCYLVIWKSFERLPSWLLLLSGLIYKSFNGGTLLLFQVSDHAIWTGPQEISGKLYNVQCTTGVLTCSDVVWCSIPKSQLMRYYVFKKKFC